MRAGALHRTKLIFLGVVVSLMLGAGLAAVASGGSDPNQPSPGESGLRGLQDPFVGGVLYANLSDAANLLAFQPVVPSSLGTPRIFVPDINDQSQRSLGLIYDHPNFGRFIVIESPTTMTQSELETLAADCGLTNVQCEGSWTITTLDNGKRALQIASNVSNGLIWLRNGIWFDVYGPTEGFRVVDAQKAANIVVAAGG